VSVTTIPPGVPQGPMPAIGVPNSQDYPRLVFTAPYHQTVPLAELIEPSVLEAVESMLPGLVPPFVQAAADAAVAAQAVMLTGSSMSGPLFLNPVLPTQPNMAASMAYVDLLVSTAGVPEVPAVPIGQTWARTTGQWVPVDPSGGNFLPITGGTMQGAISMSGNAITNLPALPVMPNGAASATWVLDQIAAHSLYQGTWVPETNTPDLTLPGMNQNGFTWIVVTSNTNGVVISQPIPGLQGLTVYNGDNIIFSAIAGQFQIVRSGGLSLGEAQALFLPLTGGQMQGGLLLNANATSTMQATTLQQVEALAAFPESPTDGQVYGRQGLSISWMPVLPLGGGILTGQLTLAANAVQPLNAVPLQQLNSTLGNYVPLGGNATIIGPLTMNGAGANLTLNSNASTNLQAVPLQQLNAVVNTVASKDVGRNLLHNSMFNVAQRGVGPFTANGYGLDRWAALTVGDTISFTQNAALDADRTAIGDDAVNQLLTNIFTGNAGAGSLNFIAQPIEGVRRLGGKTVTVSFWAHSNVALKLGVNVQQVFGSGGSPSASVWALTTGASFNLTATWARFSTTIALPSTVGKTLGTNGADCTQLAFWYSCGATNNAVAGNVGVQSGTVQLWGVQLEIGTQATPLEKPDPRYDLANCQRFFLTGTVQMNQYAGQVTSYALMFTMPQMRAAPTITHDFTTTANCSSASVVAISNNTYQVDITATAVGIYNAAGTFVASADL
jgi:hypothetical protein